MTHRIALLAGILLIPLFLAVISSDVTAGNLGSLDGAPWNLQDVPAESLNGQAFERALPDEFSSYVLGRESVPGFTNPPLQDWSRQTTNYAYYDPFSSASVPGILATRFQLAPPWTAEEALVAIAENDQSVFASITLEAELTRIGDTLVYMIYSGIDLTGVTWYIASWGGVNGEWAFEVRTLIDADRESFLRTLARRLSSGGETGVTSDTATPRLGKIPNPSPTETSTSTSIPSPTLTATPSSTPTLKPTRTVRPFETPRPTRTPTYTPTPDEQSDIEDSEAKAILCVERENFRCPVDLFTSALERHPGSQRLADNLYYSLLVYGISREEASDLLGAREQYERAYQLDPTKIEASRLIDTLRPYSRILRADGLRGGNVENFLTGTEDYGDAFYAADSLQLRAKQGVGYTLDETQGFERTSILVQARVVEGYDGYVYLAYSDEANPDDEYMLQVQPAFSHWRLVTYNVVSEEWEILIPWTWDVGINSVDPMTLELRLVDSIYYVLINRESVGSIGGSSFLSGNAEFGVALFSDGFSTSFTVAFTNLRVFQI